MTRPDLLRSLIDPADRGLRIGYDPAREVYPLFVGLRGSLLTPRPGVTWCDVESRGEVWLESDKTSKILSERFEFSWTDGSSGWAQTLTQGVWWHLKQPVVV